MTRSINHAFSGIRALTIAAVLALPVVAAAAPATTTAQPQPSRPAPSSTENTAQTGKTKPPGAALPEGHSRLDDLERKAHDVGQKSQQSICKC